MRHFASVLFTLIIVAAIAPCQSLTVLSHEVRDPYETTVLQGPGNLIVTLISHGALTSKQIAWLTALYDIGSELEILRVRSVRVLVEDDRAEITILPTYFSRDGYDLTNFLPSGIQLYYDGLLEYDFRILIGHYFLRMKGEFVSDTDLATVILAAIEAPADHLDAETSRHLDDRFSDLTTDIATLHDNDVQQSKNITKLQKDVGSLQTTDSSQTAEQLTALETGVASLGGTVAYLQEQAATTRTDIADLEKLYQILSAETPEPDQNEGQDRLDGITKQYETLVTDLGTTKTALIALNNRRGRPVNPTAVDRIVELKKASPAMTQPEIAKQLDSEGLSLTAREIDLVLSVYFSEF